MNRRLAISLCLLTVALFSCSSGDTAPASEQEPQVPIVEAKESTSPIEPPTVPPEPTPEPPPPSVAVEITDEAKQTYLAMLLIQIDAEFLMEAAERTKSGDLEGFEQFGSLIVIAALIKGVDESLPEISPPPNLNTQWADALSVHEQAKSLLARWFNDEMNSSDVTSELGPLLMAIDASLLQAEEIIAAEYGLDPEELSSERDRILESLPEVFMPTPTPSQ